MCVRVISDDLFSNHELAHPHPSKNRFETRRCRKQKKSPIPAGLWTKCPKCDQVLYKEELDDSLQVCPKCGHHLRLSGRKRLDAFLDWKGVHEEIGADVRPVDTLGFVDSKSYPTRLEASQGATKETDALVVMRGELRRRPVVAAAFDFAFMGGSMGSVVGERFALGWNELCVKTFRL